MLLPAIPSAQETVVDSLATLAQFQERALQFFLNTLRDRNCQLPDYWAKGIAIVSSSLHKVHIDLSCIVTTFHCTHHCSFHFFLLFVSFHLTSGFSGQRRARVISASFHLFSLSSFFSLSCLDSLTKDCQGFQLLLPASSPSFTSFAHYVCAA